MEENKNKTPASRLRANYHYNKANKKRIPFDLNIKYDKDIIEFLNLKENKQGYIKNLIRADMAKNTD